MPLGFAFLFGAALTTFSTVIADPVIYNFTLRCDVPDVKKWCAEVYVWEEDVIEFHDALGYSWLCTQAKEVNFEMPVSPRDDGDVGLYYEMNYQVFTTCSTDKHKNRNPKDNCKTYMNNRPQDAHTHKRTVLNHKLTFDHWNGISIYQLQYKYPSAFKGLGVWYGDIDMILDSPCGWTPEDEDNMEVHWQWLGRPRDCTQLSCEGSRYINFWRKAPYERIYN